MCLHCWLFMVICGCLILIHVETNKKQCLQSKRPNKLAMQLKNWLQSKRPNKLAKQLKNWLQSKKPNRLAMQLNDRG